MAGGWSRTSGARTARSCGSTAAGSGRTVRAGCEQPATIAGHILEPFVIEQFLSGLNGLEFGLGAVGNAEIERLQRALADAEHVLEVLLGDPASLAALRPEERAKVLGKAAEAREAALSALGQATARQPRPMLPANVPIADYYKSLRIPGRRELLGYAIERIVVRPGRGSAEERVTIVRRRSEFDEMDDETFERWTREHAA